MCKCLAPRRFHNLMSPSAWQQRDHAKLEVTTPRQGCRCGPHRGLPAGVRLAGARRAQAVVALARDGPAAAAGAAQAGAAAAAAGRKVGVRRGAAAAAGAAQAGAGAQRLAAGRARGALAQEAETDAVQARYQVAVLALLARARACRTGPC